MLVKRRRKLLFALLAVLFIVLALAVYWIFPVSFNKIRPDDVQSIVLRSGTTGKRAEISDEAGINDIIRIISACDLKRDSICMGRVGYIMRVEVSLHGGRTVSFYVNGSTRVEKGIIAYCPVDGEIDFDALNAYFD